MDGGVVRIWRWGYYPAVVWVVGSQNFRPLGYSRHTAGGYPGPLWALLETREIEPRIILAAPIQPFGIDSTTDFIEEHIVG